MLTRRSVLTRTGAVAGAALALRAGVAAAAAPRHRDRFRHPPRRLRLPRPHLRRFGQVSLCGEAHLHAASGFGRSNCSNCRSDLRLDRVVVVQPSVYGSDNACTVDAVKRMGARATRDRGDRQVDAAQGLGGDGRSRHPRRPAQSRDQPAGRFDPADPPSSSSTPSPSRSRGSAGTCRCTRAQHRSPRSRIISCNSVPGGVRPLRPWQPGAGAGQPDFVNLLELVKSGHAYVKISGAYRVSDEAPDYPDVIDTCEGVGRRQSRPHRLGHRLAASESNSARGKPLTEIDDAVPDRRWPACSISCPSGFRTQRHGRRSWSTIRRGSTASGRSPADASPESSRPRRASARHWSRQGACI